MKGLVEIFLVSLRLGSTSFGGPTAHLGYFQKEYVQRRKWLTDKQYADLVALSQFLPGPASSQVGMGIGLIRGGIAGSIVSFIGFTLPSVIALACFAFYYVQGDISTGWIHGLKLVAIAIVAQAIWEMMKKLLPTWKHYSLGIASLILLLLWNSPFAQVGIIIIAGLIGYILINSISSGYDKVSLRISKKLGSIFLAIFALLLIVLPLVSNKVDLLWVTLFEKFYLSGSLVFGGGHVVLPLLEAQFVQADLITAEEFLTGYGLTQAVPGPLFTFASYIGMLVNGFPGAIIATIAIFLPAFLLVLGAMPFWLSISSHPKLRGAIAGMNAAVVGILGAAFINPIVWETIGTWKDILFSIILLLLLIRLKWSPVTIVILGVLIGILFY